MRVPPFGVPGVMGAVGARRGSGQGRAGVTGGGMQGRAALRDRGRRASRDASGPCATRPGCIRFAGCRPRR